MKRAIACVLVISLGLLLKSCNTTEPPPPPPNGEKPTLELTIEDVSCIEAWIKLKTTNLQLPTTITLKQINQTSDTISYISILNTQDSLLYVDSLLPNQKYQYQVSSIENPATSNELSVTTLDTTSHIFSYQTCELGDPLTGNSSILYDVAVVEANNIYAVGEIYILDSLGQTILNNVAHWDGNEWELKKVTYNGISPVIHSVFAVDENDIWFDPWFHWNGQNFQELPIDPIFIGVGINRMWGNSDGIYVVGNNGFIAHKSTSGTWQQIASGTELALTDVFGNEQGDGDVYATGVNISEVKGVLLKGNANQFSVMINSEIIDESELFQKLYGILSTVWLDENNTIYTGGNLLFRYKNNEWNYETSLPENFIGGNPGAYYWGFISSIRGNRSNDYVIAGDRNSLKHFNGISWEQIGLPYDSQSPIVWRSVKVKNNGVVAVGFKNSYAYIIILNK